VEVSATGEDGFFRAVSQVFALEALPKRAGDFLLVFDYEYSHRFLLPRGRSYLRPLQGILNIS
jgi:hypothetical protein